MRSFDDFLLRFFKAASDNLSHLLQLIEQEITLDKPKLMQLWGRYFLHITKKPFQFDNHTPPSVTERKWKRTGKCWTSRKQRKTLTIKHLICMRWCIHQDPAWYQWEWIKRIEILKKSTVLWTKEILVHIQIKCKTLDSIMRFYISIESESLRTRHWHVTALLGVWLKLVC